MHDNENTKKKKMITLNWMKCDENLKENTTMVMQTFEMHGWNGWILNSKWKCKTWTIYKHGYKKHNLMESGQNGKWQNYNAICVICRC